MHDDAGSQPEEAVSAVADDLAVRPVTPSNLPDLAVPCLLSGYRQNRVKLPAEVTDEITRRKLGLFYEWRSRGAGAQVAYRKNRVVGQIEYYPVEVAPVPVIANEVFVVTCLQVPGPDHREEVEKALVGACMDLWTARKGVIVLSRNKDWGRHGFEPLLDDVWPDGGDLTLWFLKFWDVEKPRLAPIRIEKLPFRETAFVQIFDSGLCPWGSYVMDLVGEVAEELRPRVTIERVDCNLRDNVLKYGLSSGVAINGVLQPWLKPDPVPSRKQVRARIEDYL